MHTPDLGRDVLFKNYAAIDIETDGFDGKVNNLIAIGVGYYDGDGRPEIDVITRASVNNDELAVIQEAYSWINARNPEGVVSYNGEGFDFEFLDDKLNVLGANPKPELSTTHLDLFPERQKRADQTGAKWPSLEECLSAYDIPIYQTNWNGQQFTGKTLAEEFAPHYLAALSNGEQGLIEHLEASLREYTASDIEATIALYEADINRGYTPKYLFSADKNGQNTSIQQG